MRRRPTSLPRARRAVRGQRAARLAAEADPAEPHQRSRQKEREAGAVDLVDDNMLCALPLTCLDVRHDRVGTTDLLMGHPLCMARLAPLTLADGDEASEEQEDENEAQAEHPEAEGWATLCGGAPQERLGQPAF